MTTAPTQSQWTQGQVFVDGVGLHYHRTGRRDSPSLVLAHGLTDSGPCWDRVARALDDHFDIVMLDARNHGRSDTAPSSPDLLVEDIAAAISLLELSQPAVMGHSVGAHTMALLAARFPGLVSRLVLEDPPWTADRESGDTSDAVAAQRRDDITAWLGSFAARTDDDIAELGRRQHPGWADDDFPAWVESNQQVRVGATDGLDFGGWANVVATISIPTLLVRGDVERGAIITPSVAGRVVGQNPCITSAHVAGAGHNIRRENFERFIEVVAAFLLDERHTTQDPTLQS